MSQPTDSSLTTTSLTDGIFVSINVMRSKHNDLIQRRREYGINTRPTTLSGEEGRRLMEFTRDLIAFIRRGARTGMILDNEEERMAAQSMLTFWANFLQRVNYEVNDSLLDDFNANMVPRLPDGLCPYLGLDFFRESDHPRFFGRTQLITQLTQQIETQRVLFVMGPSGSGKSSLIRAGIIPALRAGSFTESKTWHYLPPIIPSSDPLLGLAQAINPQQAQTIAQRLRQDPTAIRPLLGNEDDPPSVIAIDQFEELFTLVEQESERTAFINVIMAILATDAPLHRLIFAMRSDFEPFVVANAQLAPLLDLGRVTVPPLSPAELREAIMAPAKDVGLKFETGVVDMLIQDLVGESAGLPLLQFSLLKLWEARERNRITLAAYERVGGGRLALARSADAFYAGLIPEDQVSTRRILLRMVRPGDGLEMTSGRVRMDDLYTSGEDPGRIDRVVQKLVAARLVRMSCDDAGGPAQLEVAHEALVRNWPQLVGWLEAERQVLATRRRLEHYAHEWQRLGTSTAGLLDETQLREAEHWIASPEALYLGYDPALARLIAASSSALREAEREREAVRQREIEQAHALAEEQRARAESEAARAAMSSARADFERRNSLRLRLLVTVLAGLMVLAILLAMQATTMKTIAEHTANANVTLATTAVVLRQTAESQSTSDRSLRETAQAQSTQLEAQASELIDQSNLARANELAAHTQATLTEKPQLSLLLAVAAVQVGDEAATIAQDALVTALTRTAGESVGMVAKSITASARNADGTLMATTDASGTLSLWNPQAEAGSPPLDTLPDLGTDLSRFVTLSNDGRWVAVAGTNQAQIYAINAGTLADSPITLTNLPETIVAVQFNPFSPNGNHLLVIAGNDGSVRGWQIDQAPRALLPFTSREKPSGEVSRLAFSPDGRWMLTGGADRIVRLWDLRVPAERSFTSFLDRRNGTISAIAVSNDSRWVAVGDTTGSIHLWTLGNSDFGSGPYVKTGSIGVITALAFSPDGKWLMSGSSDRNARLWNAESFSDGSDGVVLTGHNQKITSVTFSNDGQWAITGSDDHDMLVWSVGALRNEPYRLHGHEDDIQALFVMGEELLSTGEDGQIRRWSLKALSSDARASEIVGLDLARQVDMACKTAGRDLTKDEIKYYFRTNSGELPCQ